MSRVDGTIPRDERPVAEILRTQIPLRDRELVLERLRGSSFVALANIAILSDRLGSQAPPTMACRKAPDSNAAHQGAPAPYG